MKKIISIVLILALALTFAGCGSKNQPTSQVQSETEQKASQQAQPETSAESGKKILTIYFSWSGNTDAFANYIHNNVGGDIVRINPIKAYPDNYDDVADYAKEERDNNGRPEFKDLGINPEDYDVIFVGYPIWWYTLPMIMYTFFDTYDFSGKTIVPFNTHEGSGDGGTYDTIKEFEPGATVLDGLAIRGNSIDGAEDEVKEWLAGLQY